MKYLLHTLAALLTTTVAFSEIIPSRSLFNGKDLTGWKGEGYAVENGELVCTEKGKSLISEGTFSNYILDFEFKLTSGANNGLGVHYPGTGDSAYTGMELQILDDTAEKHQKLIDSQFHGSIYRLAAAKKNSQKPIGEWNRQRVSILGPAVMIELNGEIILRSNLDDLTAKNPSHEGVKRRSGHIALLGYGDRVTFRNIKIAEVPPAANTEGVLAAGFTRLCNGRNLDGWKHNDSPEWSYTDGIIKHTGNKGTPADLWTEKEYGDFIMVFDWRWSGPGAMKKQPFILPDGLLKKDAAGKPELIEIEDVDSGIFLRGNSKSQVNLWNWNVGSGEVWGYRNDEKLPADVRAAVTPKIKADHPVGQWNRAMITMKGDRLTVNINNQVVIDNAQLPGVAPKGPIGLQHHGVAVDFANLWIKEL